MSTITNKNPPAPMVAHRSVNAPPERSLQKTWPRIVDFLDDCLKRRRYPHAGPVRTALQSVEPLARYLFTTQSLGKNGIIFDTSDLTIIFTINHDSQSREELAIPFTDFLKPLTGELPLCLTFCIPHLLDRSLQDLVDSCNATAGAILTIVCTPNSPTQDGKLPLQSTEHPHDQKGKS